MATKQVLFKNEAKQRVKKGIDITCAAIRSTIGPKGKNAFIDDQMQPKITNDGKTIANAITLEDKFENMGAWVVKNASGQTDDEAGDGTSTTSVLLKAIIDEAQKRPESPMDIKRSLQKAGAEVEKHIKAMAKPVKGKQVAEVATISAESPEIGNLIAEIVKKAGEKLPVSIEPNPEPEITYDISLGLETKAGMAHIAFMNDTRNGTCELSDVAVFVTDRRISSIPDIAVLLRDVLEPNRITSIVIIASDVDNGVLGTLIQSKLQGTFNSLVIRARDAELEDMAAMTGATVISELNGLKFGDVRLEHLGKVKKIVSSDKKTLIVNDCKEAKDQEAKLRALSANSKNMYEKKFLEERADKLAGGVVVIKVGAPTDSEREYLKYKIEDAVNATKSAIDEGIVEGGGMCLYRISNKFKGNSVGEVILRNALKEPLKAIIENCEEDYTNIVKRLGGKKGYDAKNNRNVDMIKEGIIDPARVTRCAFKNALSTASNFITADVVITENPEKKHTGQGF